MKIDRTHFWSCKGWLRHGTAANGSIEVVVYKEVDFKLNSTLQNRLLR